LNGKTLRYFGTKVEIKRFGVFLNKGNFAGFNEPHDVIVMWDFIQKRNKIIERTCLKSFVPLNGSFKFRDTQCERKTKKTGRQRQPRRHSNSQTDRQKNRVRNGPTQRRLTDPPR
jgi:hypothetical protein